MASSFYEPGEHRASKVNALFGQIARRYDFVNDVQSFGLHRAWKRKTARLARVKSGTLALDVCCGTGDICQALARSGAAVVGLDFNLQMLQIAHRRNRRVEVGNQTAAAGVANPELSSGGQHNRICLIQGDAERLPFLDNTFDAVTAGYGLRNLEDWRLGLSEMRRVAKPAGRVVVLEFGKPSNVAWRFFYFSYLTLFVPFLGLAFCGNPRAYSYILQSLHHYPSQIEVAETMGDLGLINVQLVNLLGGAMSIHCADKAK